VRVADGSEPTTEGSRTRGSRTRGRRAQCHRTRGHRTRGRRAGIRLARGRIIRSRGAGRVRQLCPAATEKHECTVQSLCYNRGSTTLPTCTCPGARGAAPRTA
jgi:hypothetical protein